MRAALLGLICIVGLVTTKNGTDPFDVKPPFRRCFVNEEFTKCAPLCQPKCGQTKPKFCSLRCIPSCQCKTGFLRNRNGACVANCTDNTSRRTCAANEEFKDCGSACEPTCRNPRPRICSLECVVGCQCKSGFFRDDNNVCVKECDNASSNICSENEEFRQCGTACEPSCENPNPQSCTKKCVLNVCQCKRGFVRGANRTCIHQQDCPGGLKNFGRNTTTSMSVTSHPSTTVAHFIAEKKKKSSSI
ncbi:hypothetical protein V3C99_016830 [Haemonchus contortus]